MSYLKLAKRIMNDELSSEELVKNLETPNVIVLQQVILKLIQHNIKSDFICRKLIEYSNFMDRKFKILGPCKLGHLAIYSLKELGYTKEYKQIYTNLGKEDLHLVDLIDKSIKTI
ncbi:hypothetical protein SH1V18_21030 [Vallitalea longa]|uniref:Uncharacterized protein n=1 Tax=Vallitalea longa TaxID=2936439 RepID=A0A9W5YEA3_9FIRM|nr:hypothetical protein [Vallitalea longa]GKX29623.1 hypothetical protein SH1V18_21030 [Vallitalea longa]